MRVIEPEKRDYADNILIMPKETLFIGGRIMFLCEVDDGMFRTEKLIYEEYGAFYIAKEDPDPAFEKEKYRSNNIFQEIKIFDLGYNGDPLPEEISFQKKQKNRKIIRNRNFMRRILLSKASKTTCSHRNVAKWRIQSCNQKMGKAKRNTSLSTQTV